MVSLYEILGVPPDADAETIKKAYRKLARESHPDANNGDPHAEERFKAIGEAYTILSDPDKRRRYDMGGDPNSLGFDNPFGDIGSVFESFFGGGFGGSRARQRSHTGDGRDIGAEVTIDLEDSVFGKSVTLEVATRHRCARCSGEGSEPGTYRRKCGRCDGLGELRQQRQTLLGTMITQSVCPACAGAGEGPTDPCRDCQGDGRTVVGDSVEVNIPAGIEHSQTLKVAGHGEQGVRGGRNGDLFVRVNVREHALFERHGADLACELVIGPPQATLGTELDIETLDGAVKLTVPAGVQHGSTLRLRGHGAATLRGGHRGDLLVVVRVQVPKRLSDEQRALYEQLANIDGSEVGGERRGFFGRLRATILGEQ